jgi:kynureninase
LRKKSELLTDYLAYLLRQECGDQVQIITPHESAKRGCQLSLSIRSSQHSGKEVHRRLESAGVACDWREPDVIRVAPVPLYNTFEEVFRFVHLLKQWL